MIRRRRYAILSVTAKAAKRERDRERRYNKDNTVGGPVMQLPAEPQGIPDLDATLFSCKWTL